MFCFAVTMCLAALGTVIFFIHLAVKDEKYFEFLKRPWATVYENLRRKFLLPTNAAYNDIHEATCMSE